MGLISVEDRQYLVERFQQELENPVTIDFFTLSDSGSAKLEELPDEQESADQKESCQVSQQIFEELSEISSKILVNRHEVNTPAGREAAITANINLDRIPAFRYSSTALSGSASYYGMPAGFEFGTLIETISDFSRGVSELGEATKNKIAAIEIPLEILVFVTPT